VTTIKKKWYKAIGIIVGFLFFGYLLIKVYQSASIIDIGRLLQNIRFGMLLMSILILAIQIFFSAVLWSIILKNFDTKVRFSDCMVAYNLSLLAKYLPGGIWNHVGRVVYLQRKGVSLAVTSSSIIYEFLFLTVTSATIGGFLLLEYSVRNAWIIVLIVMAMLLFICWPNVVIDSMNKILVLFRRRKISERLSRKNSLIIFLLFILSWAIYGLAFLVLIKAMNFEYSENFLHLVAILAGSWLAGYISPTPGGIGVREGLMAYFFERTSIAFFSSFISFFSRVWFICAEILTLTFFFMLLGLKNLWRRRCRNEQRLPT